MSGGGDRVGKLCGVCRRTRISGKMLLLEVVPLLLERKEKQGPSVFGSCGLG